MPSMTLINRALLKAYERRADADAASEAEHDPSGVVQGWAGKLRGPIHPVAAEQGHDWIELRNYHLAISAEQAPIHESPEEPAPVENLEFVPAPASAATTAEIPAIIWDEPDGTRLRIDPPHESAAASPRPAPAAAPAPEPVAPLAAATSAAPNWTWPTIVERLLACPAADELRKLADYLHELAAVCDLRCVAFSGRGHRAGRTSLIVTLAWVLAEEKSARVALVDAHFENPGLAQAFSLRPGAGLGEALCDSSSDPVESITNLSEKLVIAPLCERVPAEAVDHDAIGQLQLLLRSLRRDCDLVLVDAGPWEQTGPPRVLECRAIDAFVAVARNHNSSTQRVSAKDLELTGIQWLGEIETFVPAGNA